MRTGKAAICLLPLLYTAVFSLTVDLSPVELGNTWVYKDSTGSVYPNYTPSSVYLRTLTITRVVRDFPDTGDVTFDIVVRDSGWGIYRNEFGIWDSIFFDSSYSVNSIIKTKDSISSAGNLKTYFRFSKMDTASWDSTYIPYDRHENYYRRFFVDTDSIGCMVGREINSMSGGVIHDTAIYFDKMGLTFDHYSCWNKLLGLIEESYKILLKFCQVPIQVSRDPVNKKPSARSDKFHSNGAQRVLIVGNSFRTYSAFPNLMFDARGRLVRNMHSRMPNGAFFLKAGVPVK